MIEHENVVRRVSSRMFSPRGAFPRLRRASVQVMRRSQEPFDVTTLGIVV
jgi:hypothetical protein